MTGPATSDPASANADQIAYWNGRAGAAWTDLHDRTDEMFLPITAALMDAARLRPGERVLDVGCGCGDTTLRAAAALGPGGAVVGIDVSEPMLAQARARGAGHANASFRLEDAATARFDPPFDAGISRFGVMFFNDPIAAFRNIGQSLRPGGRIVFVCWQHPKENEWVSVPMRAAKPFIPDVAPPTPGTPGPFAFAERSRVEEILVGSGFVDVDISPRQDRLSMGRDADDALAQLRRIGPLARAVVEVAPEVGERALAAARDAVVSQAGEGLTLTGATWLVTACRA